VDLKLPTFSKAALSQALSFSLSLSLYRSHPVALTVLFFLHASGLTAKESIIPGRSLLVFFWYSVKYSDFHLMRPMEIDIHKAHTHIYYWKLFLTFERQTLVILLILHLCDIWDQILAKYLPRKFQNYDGPPRLD
jgi:hypothetical protein